MDQRPVGGPAPRTIFHHPDGEFIRLGRLGRYEIQVRANDKKRARLNCISHLLSQIPYKDVIADLKFLLKNSSG